MPLIKGISSFSCRSTWIESTTNYAYVQSTRMKTVFWFCDHFPRAHGSQHEEAAGAQLGVLQQLQLQAPAESHRDQRREAAGGRVPRIGCVFTAFRGWTGKSYFTAELTQKAILVTEVSVCTNDILTSQQRGPSHSLKGNTSILPCCPGSIVWCIQVLHGNSGLWSTWDAVCPACCVLFSCQHNCLGPPPKKAVDSYFKDKWKKLVV